MAGEPVFLSLLRDPAGGRAAELLRAALAPARAGAVHEAPVSGAAFLSARGEAARHLDAWWEARVPAGARPIVLVMDEPELERHLSGLDAEVLVGVARAEERLRYARFPQVRAIVATDPLALAQHAIAELGGARREDRAPSDPFSELAAVGPLEEEPEDAGEPASQLSRAGLFGGGRELDMPSFARAEAERTAPGLVSRLFGRRRRPFVVPREIGDVVLGLRPAPLVVVPARKGGVGKTVTAGAVAQVVGYALGETTGTVAVVDQNIGNPDQWGRLDVPAAAGTVRQMMAALSSGRELPPPPAWARTPALAVYPEDRTTANAYPPGLVQRFVQQLRQRHVFMVVDLPNRLPDFSSAEAAICAAYLDLANLVILPTTDDPSALLGVVEYLDSPSLRGKPVVVSYIASTDRQLRRHPVVRELLEEIRRRVAAVETVPRSEKATLAIVKGMSILDISPRLREAYIRVTRAAVQALAAPGLVS